MNELTITIGPPGQFGKRRVVARLDDKVHTHTFDPFDQKDRRAFREAVVDKFELPDEAHEYIDKKILAADDNSQSLFKPVVTILSSVTPRKVEWLWPNRIPIGKNCLVVGDGGLGKSLLTLDIAARVSRGAAWPDARDVHRQPAGVVILTLEDDPDDTIVPRLLAHGADLSRIAHLKGITAVDGDGKTLHGIDLAQDIENIRTAINQVENCKLVIVDTISDYLGSKSDANKNRDVRAVLNPMAAMANECRVANLCISHIRKGDGRAIHAAMGSVGFTAQCRVAWAITKCPTNPKRRLMTCIKNNLADDSCGLAYRIEPYDDDYPVLAWEAEPVRMSADQAMDQLRRPPGRKPEDRDAAANWLRQRLAEGPTLASDILDDAEAQGFQPRTVRRAFDAIEGKRRKDGFNGGWIWTLPDDDTPEFSPLGNLRVNTDKNNNNEDTKITKGTDYSSVNNGHYDPDSGDPPW